MGGVVGPVGGKYVVREAAVAADEGCTKRNTVLSSMSSK